MNLFKRRITYEEFWKWFMKYEKEFFELQGEYNEKFNNLSIKLNQVNENLTFEFNTELVNGKREFMISADGMVDSFKDVIELVRISPLDTKRWNLISFRQKTGISEIEFKDYTLKADLLFFSYKIILCDQIKQLDLDIFVKNLPVNTDTITACFIFLDNILGEYQVVKKLRYIEFYPFEVNNIIYHKIEELPSLVDSL